MESYIHFKVKEVIDDVFSKTNLDTSSLVLSEEKDVIIPSSGETHDDIPRSVFLTGRGFGKMAIDLFKEVIDLSPLRKKE